MLLPRLCFLLRQSILSFGQALGYAMMRSPFIFDYAYAKTHAFELECQWDPRGSAQGFFGFFG